jgi:aquaporin Z
MTDAVKRHWPEYLMEAGGLGLFMISASGFTVVLFHPASPGSALAPLVRRLLMGMAMGLTAITLIYSPWGKQSGAHFNPAVTVTFLRLGRVAPWDAAFYVGAQFIGSVAGLAVAVVAAGGLVAAPSVNYVATIPGRRGTSVAFVAEVAIAFVMMTMVLVTTARLPRFASFTGLFAGALVAVYITLEAPLSGMSLNPARSFASALLAQLWTGFWIYLTAPLLGMLLAAELHQRSSAPAVPCAKLHHANDRRCIFRCRYGRNPA